MKAITQLKMVPAREHVANALRRAILTRELQPGDVINLNDMAQKLGVSNTPVREALQILAQDGLVEQRRNKGAVVLGVNAQRIREYYQVRAILEREVASMAAESQDEAQIERIRQAFSDEDEIVQNGHFDEYAEYNSRFHREIWACSNNQKLISMLSSLWINTSQSTAEDVRKNSQISHSEHKELLTAILNKDAKEAGSIMHAHIIRSMNNIIANFEDDNNI